MTTFFSSGYTDLPVLSSTVSRDHESQCYSNARLGSVLGDRLLFAGLLPLVCRVVIRSRDASSHVLSEGREKNTSSSVIEQNVIELYSIQEGIMERSIGIAVRFRLLQISVIFQRVLFVREIISLRIA